MRYGLIGQEVDRLVFRPLMEWATRWSFDRLRLWLEKELNPRLTLGLWLLKVGARLTSALGGLVLLLASHPFWHGQSLLIALLIQFGLVGLVSWQLSGRAEVLTAVAMTGLMTFVVLAGGYSGSFLSGLLCLAVIALLTNFTPTARRAAGIRRKGQ